MRRLGGAVLALGIAALAAAWTFGSVTLAPLGVGLTGAALVARAWARLLRRGTTVERVVSPGEHVEGGDVRVEYRLGRRVRLPGCEAFVREHIGLLGLRETRLGSMRGSTVLRGLPRGVYAFNQGELVFADPFGLEQVRFPIEGSDVLFVHPRIVELESLFCESGRRDLIGRNVLLRRPSGFDLHSVREYEQGESLRKVHWPTTARRGVLMVKDLEDAPRDSLVVLLDCDGAGVAGPRGNSSFDAAVRIAGSLTRAHAALGRRAALVLDSTVVRITSLETEWRAALDALAAVEPLSDRPLARVLADERGPAGRAPELVVVTSLLERRAVDRLLAATAAGRRVAVVLVDAPTFAGAPSGPTSTEALRLSAADVPVATVGCGVDLRTALEGPAAWSASA